MTAISAAFDQFLSPSSRVVSKTKGKERKERRLASPSASQLLATESSQSIPVDVIYDTCIRQMMDGLGKQPQFAYVGE